MRPLPKTCDSCALHAKGKLAMVIKLRPLRWGDYPGGPRILTRVLSERGRENANTLIVAQEDPFWTPDLQVCEKINLHCVKSPCVCPFLWTTTGNDYRSHIALRKDMTRICRASLCPLEGAVGQADGRWLWVYCTLCQASAMPGWPVWRELQAESGLTGHPQWELAHVLPLPTRGSSREQTGQVR